MKSLRIFLANISRRLRQSPQVVPPMGIMSLAAHLRSRFDITAQLFNLRLEPCSMKSLARRIVAFEPDVVALGSLTASVHLVGPLTEMVRAALPKALIILGGPAATANGRAVLSTSQADVAVAGEGELPIESVIREWFDGSRRLDTIPGIFWRDGSGEIVQNPGSPPVLEDLDSLPFPAYDLIDLPAYWRHIPFGVVPYRKYVSILTSRGCPYPCMYCQHALGREFRAHSAARVVDEIAHCVRNYGVDTIEMLDDIFNYDPNRVLEFCELIVRRNLKIHITFPNGMRGDLLTEEIIDALHGAGLDHLTLALETATPRIQELVGKRLNIERLLANARYAAGRGILTQCYNMLGFPTETEAEARHTVDTVLDLPIHMATFFTVTPFPGTELHALARKYRPEKLAQIDWRNLEIITARINVSEMPDSVLFHMQGQALRKFYMNPSRVHRVLRDHPNRTSLGKLGFILGLRTLKGILG